MFAQLLSTNTDWNNTFIYTCLCSLRRRRFGCNKRCIWREIFVQNDVAFEDRVAVLFVLARHLSLTDLWQKAIPEVLKKIGLSLGNRVNKTLSEF